MLLALWVLASSPDDFSNFTSSSQGNVSGTKNVAHYISEAQNHGGLENAKALQILIKMLQRRRSLYASTPSDDSEWASDCSILIKSELEILSDCERCLDEKLEGKLEAGSAGRKRKVGESGNATTMSEAAFSLFD